jgi:hypothetical protein
MYANARGKVEGAESEGGPFRLFQGSPQLRADSRRIPPLAILGGGRPMVRTAAVSTWPKMRLTPWGEGVRSPGSGFAQWPESLVADGGLPR